MNINEEIEEDSVLFDIVDSVELRNEEPDSGNYIEELDFDKSELDDFEEMVEKVLKNAITHVLMSNELDFKDFIEKHDKPVVIMFIGVNVAGKLFQLQKLLIF